MKKTKLIRVSEETWMRLMDNKIHHGKKNVDEVVSGLLKKKWGEVETRNGAPNLNPSQEETFYEP